ncbi:MAG: PAS domain-containing protein [Cyanobacteria bacterium Co-bin13]|nr:PAS domain-containing protein [Cyanobacteria bacterium Co-bin13]
MPEDADKTKDQLLSEIALLRQRVQALELFAEQSHQQEQVLQQQLAAEQTHFRLANYSLQALQQQATMLFEVIPDALICVDNQWRYTVVNSHAEALLSRHRSSLLGKNVWETFPSLVETQAHSLSYQAMAEQVPIEYEEFYSEFDKWFAIRLFPSPTGLSIYFRDITQAKRAELALQRSSQRVIRILESITDGFAAYDPEWRYTYVNQRAAEMVCKTQEELLGQVVWQVFPEAVDTVFYQAYHRAVAEQVPVDVEAFYPALETWFRIRAYPSPEGLSVYYQDVTQDKQSAAERDELLLREQTARQQAEAANRIKDEFLAVLSHELRTPLNPIVGWTRMLLASSLDEGKRQSALETIDRNARSLSQLIEDLLDVSRILQGKLMLQNTPVNLVAIIASALETVRLAAEARSIELETDLTPHTGLLLGDSNRLQQVVWNLLANAVKFTPAGGRVEVRLSYTQTYAQIEVIDTGQGIESEFLPHIFDHFRQADATTTRTFGGLGLGLAIARHIVELHGGTITAQSPGLGKGATFTVKLPLQSNGTPSPIGAPSPAAQASLAGTRVLIVDDDEDTRNLTAYILEQSGAIPTVTASAQEALVALAQSHPDILVSDIGMPEVDGYMLIRQIRQLPAAAGGQMPAIALTAYAGDGDQRRVLEAGFQRHVTKPIDPVDLVNAISEVIEPPA